MVSGASRQEAEIEAANDGAQPAARQGDAEFLVKPLPQISLPPAHHPMHGGDRAVLEPFACRGRVCLSFGPGAHVSVQVARKDEDPSNSTAILENQAPHDAILAAIRSYSRRMVAPFCLRNRSTG